MTVCTLKALSRSMAILRELRVGLLVLSYTSFFVTKDILTKFIYKFGPLNN